MDTPSPQPSSTSPSSNPPVSPLTEQTSFAQQEQSGQELQPPGKGRRIFLLCLLVAVLIAIGIGVWLWVRTLQVQERYEWLYTDDEVFEQPSESPSPVVEVLDATLTPGDAVPDIQADLDGSSLTDLDTELQGLEVEASAAAQEE